MRPTSWWSAALAQKFSWSWDKEDAVRGFAGTVIRGELRRGGKTLFQGLFIRQWLFPASCRPNPVHRTSQSHPNASPSSPTAARGTSLTKRLADLLRAIRIAVAVIQKIEQHSGGLGFGSEVERAYSSRTVSTGLCAFQNHDQEHRACQRVCVPATRCRASRLSSDQDHGRSVPLAAASSTSC